MGVSQVYADKDFYEKEYGGTLIPEAELGSFLARASDDVDQMTYNRIAARGYLRLTQHQMRQVKMATCAQADFLYEKKDMPDWVASYSAGDVSVSKSEGARMAYSDRAIRYLRSTNLLYAGLGK